MPEFLVRAWYISYKYPLGPITLENLTVRQVAEEERQHFDEIIKPISNLRTNTHSTVSYLGVESTVNSNWILECIVGVSASDSRNWHREAQNKASKLFDAACASLALGANTVDGEYQIFWIAPKDAVVPKESPMLSLLKLTIVESSTMSQAERSSVVEWWNIINHPSNEILKQAINFWVSGHDAYAHDVFGWFLPFAFLAFFKTIEIISSSICKAEKVKKKMRAREAYPAIIEGLVEQLGSKWRVDRKIQAIREASGRIRELDLDRTKDKITFAAKMLGIDDEKQETLVQLVDIRNGLIAHASLNEDEEKRVKGNISNVEALAREWIIRFAGNR